MRRFMPHLRSRLLKRTRPKPKAVLRTVPRAFLFLRLFENRLTVPSSQNRIVKRQS